MTDTPATSLPDDLDPARPLAATCTQHDIPLLTCWICNDVCAISDLPRWMCPHCPDFTVTQAADRAKHPIAPDQPARTAGYWSLRLDGRGDWRRRWEAVDTSNDIDDNTHVAQIQCNPRHLDDGQAGLCHPCTQQLRSLLADVPFLLHHLELAIVGDHRFVQHGSYIGKIAGDDVTLDWSERASTADSRLRASITELHQAVTGTKHPLATITQSNLLTITHGLDRFAQRPDAQAIAATFSTAVISAHHAIDRPADLAHYGRCPQCQKTIIQERVTDPGDLIRCSHADCDYITTLKRLQDRVINDNADQALTVSELVAAISWAGVTVTRNQIHGWIRRRKLEPATAHGPAEWTTAADGTRTLTRDLLTGYPLRDALTLAIEAQHTKENTQ